MMMGGNPNVFTAAQWEELEQQALIYKYMVSGVPVPTDLILSVRRSLYNSSSSSSSSSLSYNHLTFGGAWEGGYPYNHQLYQIGGGRKIDLEPGRCRRTDGKKWRCSKEAFPDSKYCERHMHRGRNRSRKPVELSSSSSSSSSTAVTANVSSSPSTTISKSAEAYPPPFSSIHTNFITSSSYSNQSLKDYRNLQQVGVKNLGENERSSFFQPSDPFNTMPKMQSGQHHHFSFQNLKGQQKVEETQGQHCFVMGTDFIKPSEETSTKSAATQMDTKFDQTTSKQPFHHFFSPPKTTMNPNQDPNWVDVDHQLSIIPPKAPLSTQELFQSKPRPYW